MVNGFRILFALLVMSSAALAACERPCTLDIARPDWCEAQACAADEEFCREICTICQEKVTTRDEGRKQDCKAHCRRYAGLDALKCEEIDEERIAIYRYCVDNSDFILCD